MNHNDPNFDWVAERAKCSANEVYRCLALQVERDVKARNGVLSGKEQQYEVNFIFSGSPDSASLTVTARTGGRFLGERSLASVIFTKIPEGILAVYADGKEISGLLTLSQEGECRLRVNDNAEYSFWQFRKLTLEPIFFDAVREFRP